MQKRDFHQEIGIAEYWIVDVDERRVRVVKPRSEDVVATDALVWTPRSDLPPLFISLVELFKGLGADEA